MKKTIEQLIVGALEELRLDQAQFAVEHPADLENGDYSTNVAFVLRRRLAVQYGSKTMTSTAHHTDRPPHSSPLELAKIIKNKIDDNLRDFPEIERVEIAGSGFINFHLSKDFFKNSIGEIIEKGGDFGKSDKLKGQKTVVEYTDPNPFKEFHIGHLMSNTIGEAVSRVVEWSGAEVKRACYQGDVGMHVAQAVWAMKNGADLKDAYATGARAYKEDESAKQEIQAINKKLYARSDDELNGLYDRGRKESLEKFDEIYDKLGTKFDYFFFESETGEKGKNVVEENKGKLFEESEGATVFKAENFDPKLHTRVFLNSEGLPTYEAKELGLAPTKYEKYPYDKSIVITGNEVNEYFKVVLEAMRQVFPNLAEKTEHLSHGMLRLPTGKMSSRTGDVITAEELIGEVQTKTEGREDVAIGAIKYMILRQAIGGDIIFDFEKSVSTEGDSGVYLQYAYARTNSLLEKAEMSPDAQAPREGAHEIERLLYRFPEVVERALEEYSPNYIATYLTELAASFNNFYAHEQVISEDSEAPYRLAITKAFNTVMKNGLDILGIPAPERI